MDNFDQVIFLHQKDHDMPLWGRGLVMKEAGVYTFMDQPTDEYVHDTRIGWIGP